MIRFVVQDLFMRGFHEESVISTLERMMQCGIGKCNHCAIGHRYVCRDGPVFNFNRSGKWSSEAEQDMNSGGTTRRLDARRRGGDGHRQSLRGDDAAGSMVARRIGAASVLRVIDAQDVPENYWRR